MSENIAAAAAVRLTLRYPFWTEIYYSMTVKEATAAEGVETQATDGRNLWINRAFFESIPLDQQVSEIVHELCHKIFLHTTRRGHRDPKLWNIACDYVINAMMKTNGFTIPSDWLLEMKYDGWLAEAVYAELARNHPPQPPQDGGQGKGPPTPPQGQGGPQMPPGRQDIREPADATPEEKAKHEDEVKALVDRAIANAKAMGNMPGGIEQGTVEAFKAPNEPWFNHLHRFMQSLSVSEYNWARINRRALKTHGVFAPLHYSEALGEVALFIDTSGSCFAAAEQARFADHLNAILAEAKPKRVHLYYFDTQVHAGQVIEAGEIDIATKPTGGGGTSFVPIFEEIEREGIDPEVCIILTDLLGRFPAGEPGYPVVWANTLPYGQAPFGETIYLAD
jgi:predicted metal-dependent peptidase